MLRPGSDGEVKFRLEVRNWLKENLSADLRDLTFRPLPEKILPWCRKLYDQGWIAPHWPKYAGGMGATPVQQVILMEELALAGAPDAPAQGLNHIGPLLIKLGSDEQKKRHLPSILKSDVIWCQGYSEPNAGSDLTSLRTKADIDGDELVINGHKIWTSWAQHAHWMFALVRTGGGSSNREGITFVLIDMASDGITRRPIENIARDEEFCEVFLDDVRVPISNVVREIGQGWSVATTLLNEERIRIGGPVHALRAMAKLRAMARYRPESMDSRIADQLARAEIEVEALTASYLDSLERFEKGESDGSDSSYLKILGTETTQFIHDIAMDIAGDEGARRVPITTNELTADFSEMFLQSMRLPIYGGSNEIQRSILAGRVLHLPRG